LQEVVQNPDVFQPTIQSLAIERHLRMRRIPDYEAAVFVMIWGRLRNEFDQRNVGVEVIIGSKLLTLRKVQRDEKGER
jgi:hypothetical protein